MVLGAGVRRGILLSLVLLSGACAGERPKQAPIDATAELDQTPTTEADAKPADDAAPSVDAGGAVEVAPMGDATSVSDSGAPPDSSPPPDAGAPPPDAMVVTDAAAPDDSTPTRDAAVAPGDTRADVANDGLAAVDAKPVDGATSAGKQTLFYLDVQGRVMSVDAQGGTARTVVSSAGQGPDGIAIDKVHGYIYWTTMGSPSANDGTVMRAKLDGSAVTTLVPKGDTFTPKQMKIDVATNKMYWSDREGMRVQRSNLDGTQLETLVTVATGDTARMDNANWCVGIALDLAGGWLYWTQKGPDNGKVGSIRRAHIELPAGQTSANRTDVEVLWSGLPEPIDLDVDVAGGFLYWTDRGDDTVNRGPIALPAGATAASRKDRQVLVREIHEAIGVVLDPPHGVLYYTSATGQLGRANLDGTGPVSLLTKAGALTGIVVVDED